MADVGTVSTDIYRPLQSPQQQMQPLDVIRLIGGLQENQLRQQNIDALNAIGGAYSGNVGPNGEVDYPAVSAAIARSGGVRAGEGLQQATANARAAAALSGHYQQTLRGIYGALADKPGGANDDDLSAAKVSAAGALVPPAAIQQFVSTMPKDEKARRQWFVAQRNLAQSPSDIAQGTEGPIDASGVRPQITRGRAAYEMAGAGASPGGMRTNLPIGEGGALERSASDITALRSKNTSYRMT